MARYARQGCLPSSSFYDHSNVADAPATAKRMHG
jgi:hypothetical protein